MNNASTECTITPLRCVTFMAGRHALGVQAIMWKFDVATTQYKCWVLH
jgi:hypothetical protein